MVVVAAFGLLISYWALSVSLTTRQIEQLIGEVANLGGGGHRLRPT
jgi:hypothetical protein